MFTVEELPAKYYSEENIYIPPVRSVHFNAANTQDDGKLEHCLIQLHRVTRGVAKKWIGRISFLNWMAKPIAMSCAAALPK